MDTFKKILGEVDEVDLTPMIDVTFLLLIYFMVTTMIKEPEAELSIQLPGKASSSDITPMEMLKVRIGDEGEVYLNGSEIESGLDLEMPDLVANLKIQKEVIPSKLQYVEQFLRHFENRNLNKIYVLLAGTMIFELAVENDTESIYFSLIFEKHFWI